MQDKCNTAKKYLAHFNTKITTENLPNLLFTKKKEKTELVKKASESVKETGRDKIRQVQEVVDPDLKTKTKKDKKKKKAQAPALHSHFQPGNGIHGEKSDVPPRSYKG